MQTLHTISKKNAYASNPSWYVDGDNSNGESDKAGKEFFDTDKDFRPAEFMHFCSQMLVKEPKESGKSPCMIIFCEFEQQFKYIELGKRYGYTKRTMLYKIDEIIIGRGNPNWGAPIDKDVFIIKFHEYENN